MCADCEMDISTSKADQLRCSQARLGSETEECVVSPSGPGRPIGGGKARQAARQAVEVPVETTIIDVVERPAPGVVVVTEYELFRAVVPGSPGGGTGPGSDEK